MGAGGRVGIVMIRLVKSFSGLDLDRGRIGYKRSYMCLDTQM